MSKRRRVSVSFLVLVCAVAAPLMADAAEPTVASTPTPALDQISFCDFAGTDSSSERDCKRDLLSPKGAKQVDISGDKPTKAERDALAASADRPAPTTGATSDPISFGKAKGATSPTAHAGLTASESRQLFEQTYDVLLKQLASDPLPADAEIVNVANESTVVIEQPGEGTSLVESPEPLVAGVNDKPIDLDLEEVGAGFAPERPLADVTLPDNAYEPSELSDSGIGLSYSPTERTGGSDGLAAEPVGEEGLFYPEADTDTDLFLTAKATGLELFAQLRSAQSPEQLRVEVELPQGASLLDSKKLPGAAEVRGADGKLDALVSPPFATEASGEPFPVSMGVEGKSTLLIEVAHRGSGAGYPILVDPEITDSFNWPSGASGGTNWTSLRSDNDFWQWEWAGVGLVNLIPEDKPLGAGAGAYWHYWVPNYAGSPSSTSAFIDDAWMGSSFNTGTSTQTTPREVIAQLAPGVGWVSQKVSTQSHGQWGGWMSTDPAVQKFLPKTQAQRLDYQLWTPTAVIPTAGRSGILSNVVVELDDQEAPSADITGIGGWVDGTAPSYTVTNETTDGGLGVKSQSFLAGVDETGTYVSAQPASSSCDGTPDSPCPQSWDQDFDIDPDPLRDGLQTAVSVTLDAVGKPALGGEWYGIDRQQPAIEVVGHPLQAGGELLRIEATDGDPRDRDVASMVDKEGAQSGVERIELRVDGAENPLPQHVWSRVCEGDGLPGGSSSAEVPWASCGGTTTFSLEDIADGPHDVTVEATDGAGNITSQMFSVVVGPEPTDATGPEISASHAWVGPTGQLFGDPYPDDGYDPYVTSSNAAEDPPPCDDLANEPELQDPYTDEWLDECEYDPPTAWFDESASPVEPTRPNLRLYVSASDIGTDGGAGVGVSAVEVRLDEEYYGSCQSDICSWDIPRDAIVSERHDIVISAVDNELNEAEYQLLVIGGEVFGSQVEELVGGEFKAETQRDILGAVSATDDFDDGLTLSGLGPNIEFEPQSGISSEASLDGRSLVYGSVAAGSALQPEETEFLPSGASTTVELGDPNASPEWSFGVSGEFSELRTLSDGSVAVVRPFPEIDESELEPEGPFAPEGVTYIDNDFVPDSGFEQTPLNYADLGIGDNGEEEGPLEAHMDDLMERQEIGQAEVVGAEVIAVADVESATDAGGNDVEMDLEVSGDRVFSLDPSGSVAFPVTVDLAAWKVAPLNASYDCFRRFEDDPVALAANCVTELDEDQVASLPAASTPQNPSMFSGNAQAAGRNTHEIALCARYPIQCNDYDKARGKANDFTNRLWDPGVSADNTKANVFRHMFWLSDMINRREDDRVLAGRFASAHEWTDVYDIHQFDMNVSQISAQHNLSNAATRKLREFKRASQMDFINNSSAYDLTTKSKARARSMKWFCFRVRKKSKNAKFVGSAAMPYKWWQTQGYSGTRGVFRRVHKLTKEGKKGRRPKPQPLRHCKAA